MTLNPIANEPQLRPCPACGNPTPVESASCVHCGAVNEDAQKAAREAATEHRFLSALFTRSNHFTMIFIGINVGVFLLMGLAGGFALTSVDPELLRGFGAKQNDLIAEHHQYWRVITSIFIHIGFIHLFLNNYALWIIGQEIEQIYGSARFVVLYLATGVIGSIGSYLFNPDATSAGASGAIFGLFGVMATFAFKYRKEIPKTLSRDIMRRVLPIIAINLLFGFSVKIVDNAAHIGGLLAGILLAVAIPYMRPGEKRAPLGWRIAQTTSLVLILVSFVSAFRGYSGPRLALSNLTRRTASSVIVYSDRIQEADRLLVDSFRSLDAALGSGNPNVDLTSDTESLDRAIQSLNSTPRIDADSDKYRQRLLDLLVQQKLLLIGFSQSSTTDRAQLRENKNAIINQHSRFVSDYGQWFPGFLKEHGYQLKDRDQ